MKKYWLLSIPLVLACIVFFQTRPLGATLPVAGQTYTLAGSGVTASNTSSITLSSLTIPQTGYELQDSDFSPTFYITFEPGSTKRQEIASCTTVVQNANGTATLSGCSRGLLPFSPFTASTTYAFSHAGGTSVIFSDPPQLFNEYTAKANDESITGLYTFTQLPLGPTSSLTNDQQFVTAYQLQQVTSTGAVNGSEAVAGKFEGATPSEMALGTEFGSTGASLVALGKYLSWQGGTFGRIPVSTSTGYIHSSWGGVALSLATLNSGGLVVENPASARVTASTSSIPITSSVTSTLDRSWIPYKFGGDGSDGVLNLTSGTTTIDLGGVAVVTKNYTSINISAGAALVFTNPSSTGSVVVLKSQATTTIAGNISVTSTGTGGGAARSGSTGAGAAGTSASIYQNLFSAGAGAAASTEGAGGGVVVSTTLRFGKSSVFYRYPDLVVGAGGGSGNIENNANGGDELSGFGGRGAGALVIESNGPLNFTGSIFANGQNGGNGFTNESPGGAGGGGGGGGGYVRILYQLLIANTGTINVSGGTGGTGSAPNPGTLAGGGGGGSATPGNAGVADSANGAQSGGNGGTGVSIVEKNEFYY